MERVAGLTPLHGNSDPTGLFHLLRHLPWGSCPTRLPQGLQCTPALSECLIPVTGEGSCVQILG